MTRTKSSRALVSVVLAVLMAVAFMPAISFSSFAATAKKATKVTKVYHKANTTFTRTAGTAWTLKYKLSPSKLTAAAKKVVWKSSNKSVVSVSAKSGNRAAVSFKKAGTATVTAYTKANKKAKATWKFKVVNAPAKVAATGVTVKANNSTDYTQTLSVGTVLTATVAPADATGVTYQWYADGTAISGATDAQFTVTSAQIGKKITVKAKANTGDEVTSAESAAVSEVKIDGLALSGAANDGTIKIGDTLTVKGTVGTGNDAKDISDSVLNNSVDVQWYRTKTADNGNKVDEAISGATGTSYKVADADAGYTIYAIVTPKSGVKVSNQITGYKDGKVTLTASKAVSAASTTISGVKIQINGKDTDSTKTYDAGSVLTAVVDPAAAANAVDYQWYQGGYKIDGATSATYTAATSGDYTVKITLKSTEMKYGFADKTNKSATSAKATVKASKAFSGVTLTNVTASNEKRTDNTTRISDSLGVQVSGVAASNYTVEWHYVTKDQYGDAVDHTIKGQTGITYTVDSPVAVGDQVYAVVNGQGTQYADYTGKTSALTISKTPSTTTDNVLSGCTIAAKDGSNNTAVALTYTGLGSTQKVVWQKAAVSAIGLNPTFTDTTTTGNTYELSTAEKTGGFQLRAKIVNADGTVAGYSNTVTVSVNSTTGALTIA